MRMKSRTNVKNWAFMSWRNVARDQSVFSIRGSLCLRCQKKTVLCDTGSDISALITGKKMSFVAETADVGSVSSLSDTAQEGHSSRTSASSHQDGDLGEGSESESYVEVEQLGEDMIAGPANFTTLPALTSPEPSPPCNVVRHVTKRTLITLHQRSVLEEYYRKGMTSASQQLTEVHELVAEKTGLDLSVVRVSSPPRWHVSCIAAQSVHVARALHAHNTETISENPAYVL